MFKKVIFFVLVWLMFPFLVNAEVTCPIGLENDPHPGQCGSYTDQNNDSLCDLSQTGINNSKQALASEDELKQMTVKDVSLVYKISVSDYVKALSDFLKIEVKETDSLQVLHDENGLCSGVAANIAVNIAMNGNTLNMKQYELLAGEEIKEKKVYEIAEIYGIDENVLANAIAKEIGDKVKLTDVFLDLHEKHELRMKRVKEIALSLIPEKTLENKESVKNQTEPVVKKIETKGVRYKFLPIAMVLLILYLITYILKEKKVLSIIAFRRIWNVVLLLAFFGSAILGILLIIRINWGFYIPLPFNMLYWHVELGTVMALVTLIHLSWYWRFYTTMFKKK